MNLLDQIAEDVRPMSNLEIKASYIFRLGQQNKLSKESLAAQLNAIYIQGRIDESKSRGNEN